VVNFHWPNYYDNGNILCATILFMARTVQT
jgi:hypothetical protein